MSMAPRILPLVGLAVGGVLAVNALAGARELPDLFSGAKAFAEEAAKPDKAAKAEKGADAKGEAKADSAEGAGEDAAAAVPAKPAAKPAAVCAPTAAELAKQAGLSPAELQILQSLGARRGQLDQREQDLDTQLALMAAAEAKVDAKLKSLTAMRAEIQGLLAQTNAKQEVEIDRMVKVFESMKAKDAAPRIVLLDDSVRLPIAAKMKERSLSAILAAMPPQEAKKLTEALARRFAAAQSLAAAAEAPAKPAPAAAQAANAKPAAPPAGKPAAPPAKAG